MNRILITLGTFSLTIFAAALLLGLGVGDLYETADEQTLRWATVHRLTGAAAALGVVLVECIVVTYFIGTSRWCREVVDTYRLNPSLADASQRLKRRAFPWAVTGMLAVIVVGALGAAGDPANGSGQVATEPWAKVHLVAAFGGVAFVAWTYLVAWQRVTKNQAVIESVLAEVSRIRRERGLDGERERPAVSATSHSPSRIEVG